MTRPKDAHARLAYDAARKAAGAGWELLSPRLREALVAYELTMMLLGQSEETLEKNPALGRFVESAREALDAANPEGV